MNRLHWVAVLAAAFGLAVFVGASVTGKIHERERVKAEYPTAFRLEPGVQLEVVFIGQSQCPWSSEQGLLDSIKLLKGYFSQLADSAGITYRTVGIALDWSPRAGFDYLARMGWFDEISLGYSWGNSMASGYFWGDAVTTAGTPRLLVFRRRLIVPRASDSLHVEVGEADRHLVLELRGASAIKAFATQPTPFLLGGP